MQNTATGSTLVSGAECDTLAPPLPGGAASGASAVQIHLGPASEPARDDMRRRGELWRTDPFFRCAAASR